MYDNTFFYKKKYSENKFNNKIQIVINKSFFFK
jgi:hypothetical protein